MKSKLILILLIYAFNVQTFGQGGSDSIEERLQRLELAEQLRKEKMELQLKEFQLEAGKELEKKKNDLDEKLDEINTKLIIYGSVFGSLTLIGLFLIFWQSFKYINRQMRIRINGVIEEKEEYFKQLVRNQEVESRIKSSAKLLVLSPVLDKKEIIEKIINKFKFPSQNVTYHTIQSKDDLISLGIQNNNYDVVIINDIDSCFDREILNELLSNTPENALFLGYATGSQQLPRNEKMNFANSKFTFYHNLINLAKYKELIS